MTTHEHSNSAYVMGSHDCYLCRVAHALYQQGYRERRKVVAIYVQGRTGEQLVGHVVEVSK